MKTKLPNKIPLVPLKDTVVFPQSILSIYINQTRSQKALESALKTNNLIFVSALEEKNEGEEGDKVYKTGCIALIMRTKDMLDGRKKALIQGLSRATIEETISGDFSKVHLNILSPEAELVSQSEQVKKELNELKQLLKQFVNSEGVFSPDFLLVVNNLSEPSQICDLVLSHLNLKTAELQKGLETFDPIKRLEMTKKLIINELEVSRLQGRIQKLIKKQIPKVPTQKEGFKYQPPHFSSKKEDVSDYAQKIEEGNLPEEAKKEAFKQLSRLEKMHAESSEASMVRTYLDWILDLPWENSSEDNLDLKNAQNTLDSNHFELIKAKERILEFLAVRSLNSQTPKGPILCFVGPPGVGKTSLGKSIANAMGRKFARISLGGVKDEAEIRGHRRTYIGSLPGKIIQELKNCGTNNPVIVLDEIDKLGSDFRGDPSSALLEVLDPEQNRFFKDHYLNLKFDLSKVLFIATANTLQSIHPALKDRLEIISISGYTQAEKIKIAKDYLVETELENSGLPEKHINFTNEGLKTIINFYTQEAGLRNLKREISSICRKIAKAFVLGQKEKVIINKSKVFQTLGNPYFIPEEILSEAKVGIATGLAWTEVGGQILYVEAVKMKHKKGGLILTGKLGEVMKESAQAALSCVKLHCEKLNIDLSWFEQNEIHVHIPSGATPKEGPSAGITLASALFSLVTDIPIKNTVAMTGEVTLSGRVLPVGGIKEKVLAAYNRGIKTIILSEKNSKDIADIPKEFREKINFVLAKNLTDVFESCLTTKKEQNKSKNLFPEKTSADIDVA